MEEIKGLSLEDYIEVRKQRNDPLKEKEVK
jgi:hypothetical protein